MDSEVPARARALIDLWFDGDRDPDDHGRYWFQASAEEDGDLCQRFGDLVGPAQRGMLDDWATTPEGLLALVLLLDQVARNVHRGTAQQFAGDAAAVGWARHAIERDWDRRLDHHQRAFLYMPFMHSEDVEAQRDGLAAFARMRDEAHADGDKDAADSAAGYLRYAEDHAAVVERFGRMPDRNRYYGRQSTDEERAWLRDEAPGLGWPEKQPEASP